MKEIRKDPAGLCALYLMTSKECAISKIGITNNYMLARFTWEYRCFTDGYPEAELYADRDFDPKDYADDLAELPKN